MSSLLAFMEVSAGKRYLFIPERKCPVEVVFREAEKLFQTEGALLIFKDQALLKGTKDAMVPGEAVTITAYDPKVLPANQELDFHRAALCPKEELYETIRMLVGGCVLKTIQEGSDISYELTDEG